MKNKEIVTKRLILRKFQKEDQSFFYKLLKDEAVNKFLPWFPVKSMEETKQFLKERYLTVYEKEQGYAYVICLKETGTPVGYVNISGEESHDLGYGLARQYWNQGIVTEACQGLIQRVKQEGLPYITATHDRENIPSGKVMRKLGMSYQYSYEEQWQPKNYKVIFRLYQLNFAKPKEWRYERYWKESQIHFVEKEL